MLQLRNQHLEEIISHAREVAPSECCGLIAGDETGASTTVYRLRNVATDPLIGYEAAPEELFGSQRQMRDLKERLIAIYHSHPRAIEPIPSDTDVRLAYYPDATYIIVALGGSHPVIRSFQISERNHTWKAVEYEVTGE